VKWKNIDIGQGYYYITGTFTEWLPLFERPEVGSIVCEEITRSLADCTASLAAYVLMPDHLHLLVYLPEKEELHRFCKLWRGRSAMRIVRLLKEEQDQGVLKVLSRHANGKASYAVWKEQVRALGIWDEEKLKAKVRYIHANPVRKKYVENPGDWPHSSFAFYELGASGILEVTPPVL